MGETNPKQTHLDVILVQDNDDSNSNSGSSSDKPDNPAMDISDNNIENDSSGRSSQIVNQVQKTNETRLFNAASDKYNFKNVHVYIESTNNDNLGRLHPLKIGHILHKQLKVPNIVEIKSIGRNRIKVELRTLHDANNLVKHPNLISENLKAYIPNHLLETKGIIRGVDTQYDPEYLSENIECQSKVLNIKRLHRRVESDGKVEFKPKQMILVTFEGNILPNQVAVNRVFFAVEQFIGRVTQCFKCLKFGHISKQCKSSRTICINCGSDKFENHNCEAKDKFCIHCEISGHVSVDKSCPFYENQKKIKNIMINQKTSFREAKAYCDSSFAGLATRNTFSVLENRDENFPPPPLPTFKRNPPILSQPSTSTFHSHTNSFLSQPKITPNRSLDDNRKKRKAGSPIALSPNIAPIFPFQFGPSKPLPANPYKPQYNDIEKIKDNLSKSIIEYIFTICNKIQSIEDVKSLDNDLIKRDINLVLEGTFSKK